MPAPTRVASSSAKLGRERAEQQHDGEPGDADLDAAHLAEAVADRAEERLRQRVGQRVGGVEQRRGRAA